MGSNVLVVMELRKLGDALLSLPFVRGAKSHFDVYVCCHPSAVPIFETQLPRDHIVDFIPPWVQGHANSLLTLCRVIRKVRSLHPQVVVGGWADARVELMIGLTGASRRVGFPMTSRNYYACKVPWRRRHLHRGQWLSRVGGWILRRRLLTSPLSRDDEQQSHLRDWVQVGDELGVKPDFSLPWLSPGDNLIKRERVGVLKQLRESGLPLWIVHPGAGAPVKQWEKSRFEKVLKSFFIPLNIPVVVIVPPGDVGIDVVGPRVLACKTPTIESLMELTSMADAVLCNDSAMSHLASALGKSVVAVFGPSDPMLFAPFGNEKNVVIKGNCVWRPCMDRCLMASVECMNSIGTGDVLQMVQAVHLRLRKARPRND